MAWERDCVTIASGRAFTYGQNLLCYHRGGVVYGDKATTVGAKATSVETVVK